MTKIVYRKTLNCNKSNDSCCFDDRGFDDRGKDKQFKILKYFGFCYQTCF